MSLPPEIRHTVYLFYLADLDTDIDNYVTAERRTTTMPKGRALQIRNVHPAWTSILGVSCQIRREVSVLFWQFNTIRLRPGIAGSLNSMAFRNIRNIYLEVVNPRSPRQQIPKYAFTLSSFRRAMKTILRLPCLQQIDIVIGTTSVLACIPVQGAGLCKKHAHHISSFELSHEVRDCWSDNWAGYYHFRLPLTNEARLQACGRIIQEFPSLSTSPNICLASCPDHTLGLCDEITCRLLHAIEELCQESHGDPCSRLHFFEFSNPAASTWTPDTTIWQSSSNELPLIVDITDLRTEHSGVAARLRSDSFLFENMYLRKEDTDDEDTDDEDADDEDADDEDADAEDNDEEDESAAS